MAISANNRNPKSTWIAAGALATALAIVVAIAVVLASYAATNPAQSAPRSVSQDEKIRHIEAAAVDIAGPDDTPLRLNLAEMLKAYNVSGVSIAVIDNYKIAWAKAYGTIGNGDPTAVTTKTLYQAGSISKPVAAAGALALVQLGKLSLDADVNTELKSWKLPDNEFTKEQKVTLRRLMSHTGGLTIHGFPGYDVDAPLPTLVQVLNGEKPANTEPIRVDSVPGSIVRYSGGGVTIEQQMMIDASGKAFPDLMYEMVLSKIGMNDSTYQQPLPADLAKRTAIGTYADGKSVHGNWHIYPEMAAAGLWTTPTDLATYAIEIANSKHGKSNRVLTQKTTQEMLTPVKDEAGLGFFLDKNNPGVFAHSGADEGFQALLTMNAETGQGVAIMVNSDNGIAVADHLLRAIAAEYAWKFKIFGEQPDLILFGKIRGPQAAIARYDQMKEAGSMPADQAEGELNLLGYYFLGAHDVTSAILVLKKNVEEFPQSSNVYDSLGDAYMTSSQKDLAIANYEKSLELDPKNQNAIDRLKKLRQ